MWVQQRERETDPEIRDKYLIELNVYARNIARKNHIVLCEYSGRNVVYVIVIKTELLCPGWVAVFARWADCFPHDFPTQWRNWYWMDDLLNISTTDFSVLMGLSDVTDKMEQIRYITKVWTINKLPKVSYVLLLQMATENAPPHKCSLLHGFYLLNRWDNTITYEMKSLNSCYISPVYVCPTHMCWIQKRCDINAKGETQTWKCPTCEYCIVNKKN